MLKNHLKIFFKSIDTLEASLAKRRFFEKVHERRKQFKIAVIDDKNFTPLNNLEKNGFKITHFQDITSFDQVEDYPIILCDLGGVGIEFNPALQGAWLIQNIKESYPDKYIIAYTGGQSSRISEHARLYSDERLEKDASIETWCDCLQSAIDEISNPINIWKKYRLRLLEAKIPLVTVAALEDEFVRIILVDKKFSLDNLLVESEKLELPEMAVGIVRSLVTSKIIKLLEDVFSDSVG